MSAFKVRKEGPKKVFEEKPVISPKPEAVKYKIFGRKSKPKGEKNEETTNC